MNAVVISEYGAADVLELQDVPDPVAAPQEVLIEIVASGVNRADILQREGNYPPPPGAPPYPGLEVSGRIVEVGTDVTGWRVGDAVCALVSGGGYAEVVAAPAGQVLPVPAGVDLIDAAALPEVACTAWLALFGRASLEAGESVLIHGGASGVGTMAIQLAKAAGARVLVTAGSDQKLDRCRELGADVGINYRTDDFVARVLEHTDGAGVDAILDVVGGAYLRPNVLSLAVNGRLVLVGAMDGESGDLDILDMVVRRATIYSISLRRLPLEDKAAVVAAVHEHVWPLIEAGIVRPVIHQCLPLNEAPRAHKMLERGDCIGKLLLIPESAVADVGENEAVLSLPPDRLP